MDVDKFIKSCKSAHLTLGDVKKLNVGDQLDVVIWDRNFEDYWIYGQAEKGRNYNPQDFFKYNHCKIIYQGNMEWDIDFSFAVYRHCIELDTSSLNIRWGWMPIENGNIETDEWIPSGNETIDSKDKDLHWTTFPDTTRVGWRGPIMLWDKLKNMSQVYSASFSSSSESEEDDSTIFENKQ